MKYNQILLVIGLALTIGAKQLDFTLSETLLAQAEAVSYIITLVGIVVAFGWYKRNIVSINSDEETPKQNIEKQKTVLNYLFTISVINAALIALGSGDSTQMMALIILSVILISPIIFRSMQDKDKTNEITKNKDSE